MSKFFPMHEDHVAFSDEGMMLVLDMKPCEKERKEDERTEMRKVKQKKKKPNWDEKGKKEEKNEKERTNWRIEKDERKGGKKKTGHRKQGPPCEYIYENAIETEFWKLKTPKMCFQFP